VRCQTSGTGCRLYEHRLPNIKDRRVRTPVPCGAGDTVADYVPTMRFTQFFDDLEDLSKVDWAIMKAKYWSDTSDDNDRLRRRQAEFLVHQFCPWGIITRIGVKTEEIRRRVAEITQGHNHQPVVQLRRSWYYG
jgi:hypothetical protein